jgi:hypothetical protein
MSMPYGDGPKDEKPTTEEALPGVELGSDEEDEEVARETMGPEATEGSDD